jgi:hypothetical protein
MRFLRKSFLILVKKNISYKVVFFLGMLVGVILAGHSRSISLSQALAMAENAEKTSVIPITMNEMVYRQLTPNLDIFPESFCNSKTTVNFVLKKLNEKALPQELVVVPWVETKYLNKKNGNNAGIWNFTYFTASLYDLTVDGDIDERLDLEKETNVALKYFQVLQSIFHDWRLSLMGYYLGEVNISGKMKELNTTDPWIIEKQFSSKDQYLSRIVAAIILLKNIAPSCVQTWPHALNSI